MSKSLNRMTEAIMEKSSTTLTEPYRTWSLLIVDCKTDENLKQALMRRMKEGVMP